MSNHQSHYSNHRRAAELHDLAAHAHLSAAEAHDKQDHLTGHERTRQALEHSQTAYLHTEPIRSQLSPAKVHVTSRHDEIAALAHALWSVRGCPEGSAEDDWFEAKRQLQSQDGGRL